MLALSQVVLIDLFITNRKEVTELFVLKRFFLYFCTSTLVSITFRSDAVFYINIPMLLCLSAIHCAGDVS